ncbi:MAG: hypothetical protein AAGC78_12800 [Cellvibrio sp.]|uniref:hypothetical protein n=1 Tax=Cellvibrio sp. TaxID=1965322 RepID=UPI0031A1212D
MIKEFSHHVAWTDAMKYKNRYTGLIGYQRKIGDGLARILWVYGPEFTEISAAESSAEKMLEQIKDIISSELKPHNSFPKMHRNIGLICFRLGTACFALSRIVFFDLRQSGSPEFNLLKQLAAKPVNIISILRSLIHDIHP